MLHQFTKILYLNQQLTITQSNLQVLYSIGSSNNIFQKYSIQTSIILVFLEVNYFILLIQ